MCLLNCLFLHLNIKCQLIPMLATLGALDGGSPMSPVDFKKWQCPLSLFLKNCPVDLKIVSCPLSILRKVNVPCHYFSKFLSVDFKRDQCHLSNLRKGRVALSNLRVKGHALYSVPPPISREVLGCLLLLDYVCRETVI